MSTASMPAASNAAPNMAPDQEKVLVITRTFDAPRSLMFKVWTQPEHVVRWWGCGETLSASFGNDLRPGGSWWVVMRLSDGTDHRVVGTYREVVEPERLSFTWAWEDADGNLGHQTLVAVTLVEKEGKTELTLRQSVFDTAENRDLHGLGWNASLDRLQPYLDHQRLGPNGAAVKEK